MGELAKHRALTERFHTYKVAHPVPSVKPQLDKMEKNLPKNQQSDEKSLDKEKNVCYTPYVKQIDFTTNGGQGRTHHGKRL
ncbi:hypothetical protein LKD26_05265 [Faecalibacterium sp. CLA-AA-H254]|uniref:hypothetical protein n=1 Tax=Faecalibacterium hominis (ex Afrizal et al. 2022) TaxID=2881265 RepID=UPI001D0F34DC|nr:hypothetical protein [Faecalibacterium hominis (ex Afrizal et al. 2022)]MCC2122541.1 hypothetical protein [Faecalibacterium hominis (ex Afrizal et al. 2022)]